MTKARSALVLFTLSPEAEGKRKPLGLGSPERAAVFYGVLLRHLERVASGLPGIDLLVATPGKSAIPNARYLAQRGADFGESLKLAVEDAFSKGYERVVVIGNDAPEISRSYLQAAFERLESGRSAVIGPARDGGYVLLGLRTPCPEAFESMPWGSRWIARLTEQRLRCAGFTVDRLATLEDIDDHRDLARFFARARRGALTELANEVATLLSQSFPQHTSLIKSLPEILLVGFRGLRAPPAAAH